MPNAVPAQTAIGPPQSVTAAPALAGAEGRAGKGACFAALLGQTEIGPADQAAQTAPVAAGVAGAPTRGDPASGSATAASGPAAEPAAEVPQDSASAVAPAPQEEAVHALAPPVQTSAALPPAAPRSNARRDGGAKVADADPPRAAQPAAVPADAAIALAAGVPAHPTTPPAPEPVAAVADPTPTSMPPAAPPAPPQPAPHEAALPAETAVPARRDLAAPTELASAAAPEVNAPALIQGLDAPPSPPLTLERTNPVAVAPVGTPAMPGGSDAAGPAATLWPPRPGGTQHLHVDLRDDALGMVHVELGPQKDGVSAVLHVDKPELLAALVNSRDQLGRALDAAGGPAAHHSISFVASDSRDAGNTDTGQPGPGQRGPANPDSGGSTGGTGNGGSAATGLGSALQQGGGQQNHAAYRPAARGYGDSAQAIEDFLPPDVQAVRSRLSADGVDMIV